MIDPTLDKAVEQTEKIAHSFETIGADELCEKKTGDPTQLCQYIIHLNRVTKLIHAQATKLALVCKPPASVSACYKVAEELVKLIQELSSIVLGISRKVKFIPSKYSLPSFLREFGVELPSFPWQDIVVSKILDLSTGIVLSTLTLLRDANRLCKYNDAEAAAAAAGGDESDDKLVVSRRHTTGKVWALCDQLGEIIKPIVEAFVKPDNNSRIQVADPEKADPLQSLSTLVSASYLVAKSSVVTWKAMIENATEDLDEWIQDPQGHDDNSDSDIWGLSDSEEEDKDSSSDEEFDPSMSNIEQRSPSAHEKHVSPPTEETLSLARKCVALEKFVGKMMDKIISQVLVRNLVLKEAKLSSQDYYQQVCEMTYLIKTLSDKLSADIDHMSSWFIAGEYQQGEIPPGYNSSLALGKALGRVTLQLHCLDDKTKQDDTVRWFRIWLLTLEKQFVQ